MDRVRLRYSKSLRPGTWCRDNVGGVIVACGVCGGKAALDHCIHDDGTIEPSLACPHEDCPWHVMAVLDGYEATRSG